MWDFDSVEEAYRIGAENPGVVFFASDELLPCLDYQDIIKAVDEQIAAAKKVAKSSLANGRPRTPEGTHRRVDIEVPWDRVLDPETAD